MKAVKKIRGPEISYQSDEEKELIERAAAFFGTTPTAFIRYAALEAARLKTEDQRKFILSNKDFDAFISDLEKPSKPNKALIDLMK